MCDKPISVKERLPKDKQRILILTGGWGWISGTFIERFGNTDINNAFLFDTGGLEGKATHWLPIPPKPEDE